MLQNNLYKILYGHIQILFSWIRNKSLIITNRKNSKSSALRTFVV